MALLGFTGWRTVLYVFLVFLGCLTFLMSVSRKLSDITEDHPLANPVLDLRFGFNETVVKTSFDMYGPEGRRIFLIAELVDLVYMASYATWMSMLLDLALAALTPRFLPLWPWPIVGATLDFWENVCIFGMLYTYPNIPRALIKAGAIANVSKWASMYLLVGLLMAVGVRALVMALQQSLKKPTPIASKERNAAAVRNSKKKK